MIATISILILTFLIAVSVGYIGYLAFGASTKGVILYNLPNDDPASIFAKCAYVLTICGSFVLLIQPIFYIMESSNWYSNLIYTKKEKKEDKMEEEKMMEPDQAAANLSADFDTVPKEEENESDQSDTSISCGKWFLFALFRILIIYTVAGLSFLIPNIHILLTLAGSVLGTLVNIVLPVVFYNRAYNWSDKNKKYQKEKGGA